MKKILLVFFLSLTFSISFSWLSGFNYRIPILINNTLNSNNLTDYQILVTLNTQTLISAGKMRSDCGDIRFTDSDGTTLLNYWIESGCNSANTRIWVKVPNIPARSTKTIYLYYGNPSATSLSNGDATFVFFEDFNPNKNWVLSGKWHYTTYGVSSPASGNVLRYGNPDTDSFDGGANSGNADSPSFNLPPGCILEYVDRSATEYSGFTTSPSYDKEIIYISTNGGSTWTQISIYSGTWSWTTRSINIASYSSTNARIRFRFDTVDSYYNNYYGWAIDNIRIRKYTSPEPTISLGNEETNAPIWLQYSSSKTSAYVGESVNFASLWQAGRYANTYLSHFIFSWNATGTWINESYAFPSNSFQAWANITKTINNAGRICWRFYANNSLNLWNATPISCIDVSLPKNPIWLYYNSSRTQVFIGESINFSSLWQATHGYIQSSNWLSSFNYRIPILINNTLNSNSLRDYQILVTLNTQTLISQGKMRSDCGDIRFTDSDGITLLNYWLEAGCNTQNTRIWVKVPNIPARSTKTIYVYYGNPSANSLSNSTAVFGKNISSYYGRDNYYIALILANREWISGGTNLGIYGDDSGSSRTLPSSRIIYGTTVTAVYLSTNGLLRWDNIADTGFGNYLSTSKKILTAHWDDLYISTSYRSDAGIYEITGNDILGNYIAYRWATTYYSSRSTYADFEILLYDKGYIQFNILRVWSGATPNEFISRGDRSNYIDLTPRWQYMESILFVPRVYPEPTISLGNEESNIYLSHFIFSWNATGTWINESYAFPSNSFQAWANITKTINNAGRICWRFYANNSLNLWNVTPISCIDSISPEYYFEIYLLEPPEGRVVELAVGDYLDTRAQIKMNSNYNFCLNVKVTARYNISSNYPDTPIPSTDSIYSTNNPQTIQICTGNTKIVSFDLYASKPTIKAIDIMAESPYARNDTKEFFVKVLLIANKELKLKRGWNLISIPYKEFYFDLSRDECNLKEKVFHYFNGKNWEYYTYKEITYGRSYWVYADKNCTIYLATSKNVNLDDLPRSSGKYNMIGSLTQRQSVSTVANKIGCNNAIVRYYDPERGFITVDTIEPWKGYIFECS